MKPNTPRKMTMIRHITCWWSRSVSRASWEAGSWKSQGIASAARETARPDSAAVREMIFLNLPLMFFVPRSVSRTSSQSSRELGREFDAACRVQMLPDLQLFLRPPQQHASAVTLVLLQTHLSPPPGEFISPRPLPPPPPHPNTPPLSP